MAESISFQTVKLEAGWLMIKPEPQDMGKAMAIVRKHKNRLYYRLLRKIILEGQENGQLRSDRSVNELVKLYAVEERALLYDWCICNGEYSMMRPAVSVSVP